MCCGSVNSSEVRKACYAAMHDPRAERARRDLDEFVKQEASMADVAALTKEIEASAARKNSETGLNQTR